MVLSPCLSAKVFPVGLPSDGLLRLAERRMSDGNLVSARAAYLSALLTAGKHQDSALEAQALFGLGLCDLRLYRYGAATTNLIRARELADKTKETTLLAKAELTLSSVYLEMHDLEPARISAQNAQRLGQLFDYPLFLKALINSGSIELEAGNDDLGIKQFREVITKAQNIHNQKIESLAWEFWGESEVIKHEPLKAVPALQNALLLRSDDEFARSVTLTNLAEAKCQLGNFNEALHDLDRAALSNSHLPEYHSLHLRGRIYEGLHRENQALVMYSRAFYKCRRFLEYMPLATASGTKALSALSTIYADYGHLLAEKAITTGSSELRRKAFAVIAQDHAADFREQVVNDLLLRHSLPDRYFDILDHLALARARLIMGGDTRQSANIQQLTSQLRAIETSFPLEGLSSLGDNLSSELSAKIQRNLRKSEALFSYSFGTAKSFLWILTDDHVSLYQLPGLDRIAPVAKRFLAALREERPSDISVLSALLIPKAAQEVIPKADWLVFVDDPLIREIPFALLNDPSAGSSDPLVAHHTLRFIVAETRLNAKEVHPFPIKLLAIGDPIYNKADPRALLLGKVPDNTTNGITLARLPASKKEVENIVQILGKSPGDVLMGAQANRLAVLTALKAGPTIIHFATHVIASPRHSEQANIVLSLGSDGLPTILQGDDIARLHLRGALVVLDGCATQGTAVPQVGLLGLGRAWLEAGASAVVVTAAPMPDAYADVIRAFYEALVSEKENRHSSIPARAAEALRIAQQAARASRYRSDWASYSIVTAE